MDPLEQPALERLLAERACERLVLDFVHRLDLGEPASVADLFTEDGVWRWPEGDRLVEGRAALRAYFGGRPADRLSRRMMANVLVTVDSPVEARATSYFTTYRVDGHTGGMVPAGPPVQIGLPHSRLRSSGGPHRGHLPQGRRDVAALDPHPVPALRRPHPRQRPSAA